MESSNIFDKRLLEQGQSDSQGNKWKLRDNIIYLKLASQNFELKLGILFEDRFIVYRLREAHLFRANNSYGFSYDIIDNLYKYANIKYVDIYEDSGMFRVTIDIIKEKGSFLHFLKEGFEKQMFLTLDQLEEYRVELPEDANRRALFGNEWFNVLRAEFHKPYFGILGKEVYRRRTIGKVYPDKEDVFKAFKLTQYSDIKVVIIGQDYISCA